MARKGKSIKNIEQYDHSDKKRLNNPPVGLVSEDTEPYSTEEKTYEYDPHLDPQLQWAGKAEHTSFEVPIQSLHVHERIDPKTIIAAVRAKNGKGNGQMPLFESPDRDFIRTRARASGTEASRAGTGRSKSPCAEAQDHCLCRVSI